MSWGQQVIDVVASGGDRWRADEWLLAAAGCLEGPLGFITNAPNPPLLVTGSVFGAPPVILWMDAELVSQKYTTFF